jgi:hypothetical protein
MPHTQNLMIIAQNNFKVQHSSVFYYLEKIILRLEFVQINPIYFFSIKHVQKLCNYVVYIFEYTFFLLSFRGPFYFSLLGLKFPKMGLYTSKPSIQVHIRAWPIKKLYFVRHFCNTTHFFEEKRAFYYSETWLHSLAIICSTHADAAECQTVDEYAK